MRLTLSILVSLLIFSMFQSGCKSDHKYENQYLDTLQTNLDSIGKFLEIDIKTISFRQGEMHDNMMWIRQNYKDTFTDQLGMQMDQYRGIWKVYRSFVNNYESMFNEWKALERQVQTLKNSVADDKISKEDFKTAYQTEGAEIHELKLRSSAMYEKVTGVEPNYQRLAAIVDGIVGKDTADSE